MQNETVKWGREQLAKPVYIGGRLAKNRFVIQPMECGDSGINGRFSERTRLRYENLFKGGAGVIVMESVTLQYESRSTRNQLLLDVDDPDNCRMWESFVGDLKLRYPDPVFIVQLNHSGELSDNTFSRRVCVKPMPGFGGDLIDEDYIQKVEESYVKACVFLSRIGVDGVDLKFCHGYLGSQLLRPFNDRRWNYGGSFENRTRFAYELCEKIRQAVPQEDFLLGAKVSLMEEQPGGQGHLGPDSPMVDFSESLQFCKGLESRGLSFFIETLGSAGIGWNLMCPDATVPEHVYRHMSAARELKKVLRPGTTVICGGLSLLRDGSSNGFTGVEPEKNSLFYLGSKAIEKGDFDMLAIGRQSLADPFLPAKYVAGNLDAINWCTCCNRCGDLLTGGYNAGCAHHNPVYQDIYGRMPK